MIEGLSFTERYFQEVKVIEDGYRSKFLKYARPVSICLVVLACILLLFIQPPRLLFGTVSLLNGLSLFLFASFVEGREILRILSNVPVAHMQALKSKAKPLIELRNNLTKLDVNALKLLHIILKNQRDYTHNVNKFMLGDLGFVPTTLLGVSGALTLKTLFDLQTTWVSMVVAFVIILSFVGFYVRDSVEGYQKVIDLLQSTIDAKLQ